ncbi:hypothetical protein MOE91_04555 [Bacillus inaquosorum]|nr:hypothetical protein [Bacillus subtilis]MCY9028098.1 hypothetical protein [Bacillus inaquosorum]TDU11993.1 hypothetical protein DFO78_105198 [Bacillus subtilis]
MTARKKIKNKLFNNLSNKNKESKESNSMVKNILKRYTEAKVFIQHSSKEQFEEGFSKIRNKLDTLTRAYLESANDYMNPMLREMHNTEKLLKKYDETGKS